MYPNTLLKWLQSSCRIEATPVGILWTFLSCTVAGVCSYSFSQPFWFIHPDYIHSFGMYNYCYNDAQYYRQNCRCYGRYFSFSNIPSSAWQAACVLYGSGCLLLCISAALASVALLVDRSLGQKLCIVGGGLQTTAVLVLILGLVMYPLGTDSVFMRYYCSTSGTFSTGHCGIGWSYILALAGSSLALFCPILAHFKDVGIHKSATAVML